MGRRFAPYKRFRRGPHTSPAERVVWGESEQGSGRSFRRQAETESSGLCDDEAEGRLCRPEHFNSDGVPSGPRPAGVGRQGPLRAPPGGPHPQSSEAAGDGRGGAAEGVSFLADAEANDPQLVPTRWSCTSK
ncbi:hypothetical protein B5F19_09635 [Pseudoflavonifractor sp. An184]|nr:hypothetical protein B5F19_09635 [Pseudoflavonifractor sp. An184]